MNRGEANVAGINLQLMNIKERSIISKQNTKQQLLIETQYKNKQISIVIISLLLLAIILFYFFFQNTKLKQKTNSATSK
jgi:predicted PurR-regulated permease PerM